MKLTAEEIESHVLDTEKARAGYVIAADVWEKMWTLQLYDKTPKQVLLREGREQVTLPTPYNIVHLARRLIASEPQIEVPAEDNEHDDDDSADKRQRWLSAFWQRTNREQRRDIIADAAWQVLVRGRCVFEVKWIEDELPKRYKENRLPVLLRTLDPLNVGVKNGPLYTEYAYHKYRQERGLAAQRYPNLKKSALWREREIDKRYGALSGVASEVEIVDYWYCDGDGAVWNAVLCDGIFAKQPKKTPYPDIPIVEGYGDASPLEDEEFKSLSILHPIKDLWPYQCRLASQVGTGLLFYFWPAILVSNEMGQEVPDLDIRPGVTTPVPMGTKVEMVRGDVNVPLAQTMLTQIDAHIQQSTFPGVMYGQAPGQMSAGYGVSILADQARGRIAQFRTNLENTLEHVNEIVLGLVEEYASEKNGVKVWGRGGSDGKLYHEVLKPSDIQGQWHSLVSLTPQITTDDAQKQTLGLRMVEKGIISKRTFRDRIMSMNFPADEQERIELEKALDSPQMQPKVLLRAVQSYFPDTWEEVIKGTPFEQVVMMDEAPEGMQPGMNAPGMGGSPGMGAPGQGMPPGMQPPGAPPSGMQPQGPPPGQPMPPQGPPPGMQPQAAMQPPPGAPPAGPQATPEGMPPPEALIQMLLSGNMPPGVTPDMILQMLAAMGAPPELLQQLAQQAAQGPQQMMPGVQGLPPQAQGGLSPELLGMGVGQGGEAAPGVYQEMTGNPMGEDEELDAL
ncbi:MAG: hypothetical protein KAX88_04555, partial [Rhodoferax sp.]|nr:hypothetical protein [Rhodoferax sp.]